MLQTLSIWLGTQFGQPNMELGHLGDSILKHQEKHDSYFLDFLPKKSKVFDILVIKNFF